MLTFSILVSIVLNWYYSQFGIFIAKWFVFFKFWFLLSIGIKNLQDTFNWYHYFHLVSKFIRYFQLVQFGFNWYQTYNWYILLVSKTYNF